ncbi:MAG: hypothetical protein Q8O74_01285 [bacterium]|nr:hypothetical protein [bacterium]
MSQTDKPTFFLQGPSGSLSIKADDKLARQFAMLVEGQCLGLGPNKAAQKYQYSKQRYFQILNVFQQQGSDGLLTRKTGPKTNFVRTDQVVTQIVRHRFLDPDANAEVIAQKMRQCGFRVSQRSVERTLAERGLQKKTL